MKIVEMPVSKLKPYNRNNRKHPQTQIDKLAKQIAAHGWDVPIVVDKDFVIIKGHCRLKSAKQLGLKVVPVVVRDDLTPEQCNAARIADNKLSELAEIDMEALQLELDALKAIDFDLDLTAFDSQEIDVMLNGPAFAPGTEDDQGKLDEKKKHCCPSCGYEF